MSLVEVLVAVAVAAILASLLWSAAVKVLESSKSTACILKLKNLHHAMTIFKGERGDRVNEASFAWVGVLYQAGVIHSPAETSCPSTNRNSPDVWFEGGVPGPDGKWHYDWEKPKPVPVGYTVNGRIFFSNQYPVASKSYKALYGKESRVPLFMDGSLHYMNQARWDSEVQIGVAFRHRGRANVVFMDGHAESLPPDEMRQVKLFPLD